MDRQRFVCVAKCYFLLRRWKPGQVFDFVEGQLDVATGQRLRRPADVGLKNYFQEVPLDFVPQPESKASAFKVRRKRVVGVPVRSVAPAAPAAAPPSPPVTKGGRNG